MNQTIRTQIESERASSQPVAKHPADTRNKQDIYNHLKGEKEYMKKWPVKIVDHGMSR